MQAAEAFRRAMPGLVSIHDLLEDYERHQRAKGNKESSIEQTAIRLREFHAGLVSAEDCTEEQFRSRYKRLTSEVAVDTHRNRLAEVKTFWRWVVKQGIAQRSPAEAVEAVGKRHAGKLQLRRGEARALWELALGEAGRGSESGLAVCMVLSLGLRASELLERRCRDVDEGRDGVLLWIDQGKTKAARRCLEVPDQLRAPLLARVRGREREAFVFESRENRTGHRDHSWLRNRLRNLCLQAGVPVVCPHGLRGTRATLAVDAGTSAHIIARELGHESYKTTQDHYIAPGAEERSRTKGFMRMIQGGRSDSQDAKNG